MEIFEFFAGGLARLDFISGVKYMGIVKHELEPIHLTVFCSAKLPICVMETKGVEEFLANPLAWKITQVPSGTSRSFIGKYF